VLSACPVADAAATSPTMTQTPDTPAVDVVFDEPATPAPLQVAAASALWSAAAALLSAGIPGAGAVTQAELLRAAHTARVAGLHRAEASALRVVRGLRSARAQERGQRLADLVAELRELLLTAGLLAAGDPDPALIGTARRAYEPGGSLRVHGVCREPIISAAGYAGVVTHLLADDGRWYTIADVKPGGPGRAAAAATAPVALGPATMDHARLARGGLLINGATISPEGRLGAGKGVRATPAAGQPWTAGPVAAQAERPLARIAADRLSPALLGEQEQAERARELVVCDVTILAGQGEHVLALSESSGSDSVLIRLVPADAHPELAHTANLRHLATRPGLRVRVVGRIEPDRSATLRPLAVGAVPGAEPTLRLPEGWLGHADLGYDRIQGAHLPPTAAFALPSGSPVDVLAEAPLWRYRHLVEQAVAGGRRAVPDRPALAPLRAAGFHAAADLAARLAAEAARRARDPFGRLTDPDPDRYARAWLAAAAHLAAVERDLVLASWRGDAAADVPSPAADPAPAPVG
jgi:hypothetical protein